MLRLVKILRFNWFIGNVEKIKLLALDYGLIGLGKENNTAFSETQVQSWIYSSNEFNYMGNK